MPVRIYSQVLVAATLCCSYACAGQYIAVPLCKAASSFNDSTPRCVVQLQIPPNTVRLLYSISTDPEVQPPYTGLDSQVTAMLPQELGWLGIATIAGKIKGGTANGLTAVYFYKTRKCAEKFAGYKKKNCKAYREADSCKGGTFDIPWQATLFPEKCYLCLTNSYKPKLQYFTVEAVAIVAE